jgi:hypothetical protein
VDDQTLKLADRNLSARASYRPWGWLTVSALRNRRVSAEPGGRRVSDYGQTQLSTDLPLVGTARFRGSFSRVWIFESSQATTPTSTVILGVQGALWRSLTLRVHLDYGYTPRRREGQENHRSLAIVEARARMNNSWEIRGEVQASRSGMTFRPWGAERSSRRFDLTRFLGSRGTLVTTYQRTETNETTRIRQDAINVGTNLTIRRGASISLHETRSWNGPAFDGAPTDRSLSFQSSIGLGRGQSLSVVHQRAEGRGDRETQTWSVQVTRTF